MIKYILLLLLLTACKDVTPPPVFDVNVGAIATIEIRSYDSASDITEVRTNNGAVMNYFGADLKAMRGDPVWISRNGSIDGVMVSGVHYRLLNFEWKR